MKKWVILIVLQFCYTFYRPQTKRLRARKIGLQYKIRKGRKQIWGRFSNPWNSNGIEWNRLILLTWSRILMHLPNTVQKRHKRAFKFIFGLIQFRHRVMRFTANEVTWYKFPPLSFLLLVTSCLGRPLGDMPCASEDCVTTLKTAV